MADYIDRQATIGVIHSAIYPYFCGAEDGDTLSDDEKLVLSVNKTICTAIKALPPADVVEVVRCKDCAKCQVDTIFNQYWCGGERVLPNGFCNYGRRKNG